MISANEHFISVCKVLRVFDSVITGLVSSGWLPSVRIWLEQGTSPGAWVAGVYGRSRRSGQQEEGGGGRHNVRKQAEGQWAGNQHPEGVELIRPP